MNKSDVLELIKNGEKTIVELLDAIVVGDYCGFHEIDGLGYRENGKVVINIY